MFFLIDLVEKIENVRLKFGIKLEAAFFSVLSHLKFFVVGLINHKYSSLIFSFLAIVISIFVRSSRDLGHDSMAVIDVTNMILSGKKYYVDFIENNLPLFFYFNSIPVLLAKYLGFSAILAVDWWSSFVGIVALYFSSKILLKDEFFRKNNILFNVLIVSFAVGYFLRVFTIVYGEFGTKSSYFIAISFLYLSYFLVEKSVLNSKDEIIVGSLAALLFCLKPHYGFIVICVEIYEIVKKKNIFSGFCLRNYVTLTFLCVYLLLIIFIYPEFIVNMGNLSAIYFDNKPIWKYTFYVVISDFYPMFLAIFLLYFSLRGDVFFKKILFFTFCFIFIPVFEVIGGYDQRFVAYSMFLPLLLISVVYIIQKDLFVFKKNWFLLAVCFLFFQFDLHSVFSLLINLVFVWWIFMLVDILFYKQKNFGMLNLSNILDFLIFWILLIALSFVSIISLWKYYYFGWLFSALMFFFYLLAKEKYKNHKGLSKISSFVVVAVFSYVFAFYWKGVLGSTNYESSKYKTPNYISEQIIKVVGQREGDFIVISDHIGDLYPVRLIADGGYGDLLSLSYDSLYNFISNSKGQYSSISSQNQYLIDAIKEKILDFSTKTIIVKRVDLCAVGFLEFYFNDLEFKNALLQNYEFDNRIINIETKELDKNLYFGEFYDEEDNRKLFNIIGDYEVYVRKK